MSCRFQHPPVRATRDRALARDIHDNVAHRKEHSWCEGFREEVGKVCRAVHEWYRNVMRFDALAHEEVSPVDVLRSLMMFWIVSQIDRRFVVHRDCDRLRGRQAEIS
eukprot:515355-Pleurochrysis_carterae.AAC.1